MSPPRSLVHVSRWDTKMFEVVLSSFIWFLDAVICFVISSAVVSVLVCIAVIVYRYVEGPIRRSNFWAHLPRDQRLAVACFPIMFLVVSVLCRAVYLTWWKEETHEPVKFSSTLPGSWVPFQFLRNYHLDVYPVSIFVNKLYLLGCFLLFLPICIIAVALMGGGELQVLKTGLWLLERYNSWSGVDREARIKQCIYYEHMEKNYLITILGKQEEIDILEKEVQNLRKDTMKMHNLAKRERDQNHTLRMRMDDQRKMLHEQEKELSKRPPVRDRHSLGGDDCLCVICMERTRQYLLRPCNHFCICNICKPTIQSKCPVCRKHVQKYEKIYLNTH